MISSVDFKNVQAFYGNNTGGKVSQPKAQSPQVEKHSTSSGFPTKAAAAGLAALAAASIGGCAAQQAQEPVDVTPDTEYIESYDGEVPSAAELEKMEDRLYWDNVSKEQEAMEEEERQRTIDGYVEKGAWGDLYSMSGIQDRENPQVKETFDEIKTVLQQMGSKKVEKALGAAQQYEIDPYDFLAVIAQNGGISSISSKAMQDVVGKYGPVDNDIDAMAAYLSICLDRAEGDTSGAVILFTGNSEANLDKYIDVLTQLSHDKIIAIANNDLCAAYHAE